MNEEEKKLQDEIGYLKKYDAKIIPTPTPTTLPTPTSIPNPTPPITQNPTTISETSTIPTSSTQPNILPKTPSAAFTDTSTQIPKTASQAAPVTPPVNAWTSVPIRVSSPEPIRVSTPAPTVVPTPKIPVTVAPIPAPPIIPTQVSPTTQGPVPQSKPNTSYTPDHPLNVLVDQVDPEVKKKYVQKPLRTYEGDIAEALARKKTSATTIAIAENKKESGSEKITNVPKKPNGKNFLLLLLSILIIAGAVGGVYYVYIKSPLSLPVAKEPESKVSGLIKTDFQKIVPVGNIKKSEIAQKIQGDLFDGNIGIDQVSEFVLIRTNDGVETRITGSEFFDVFDVSAPDILKRSVTDKWMIGTYDINSEKLPFIIFTTDFFQNTFAGMLKWESSIPDELAILLNYIDRARPESVTGTTTLSSFFTILGRFEDRVVLNRDVREFINENGELLVLYSFIDKDTLVITTSETSLKKIIERIEKQTYIR